MASTATFAGCAGNGAPGPAPLDAEGLQVRVGELRSSRNQDRLRLTALITAPESEVPDLRAHPELREIADRLPATLRGIGALERRIAADEAASPR